MSNTLSVEEGNRVILEFMGGVYDGSKYWTMLDGSRFIHAPEYDSQAKYHTSWDWLMPVVEKIEGLFHKGFAIVVNISGDGGYIGINGTNAGADKYEGKREIANTLNANYFNDFPGADKVSKIEAVWQACVQFIQWYNNQNKK
jgi:hypothetical protein